METKVEYDEKLFTVVGYLNGFIVCKIGCLGPKPDLFDTRECPYDFDEAEAFHRVIVEAMSRARLEHHFLTNYPKPWNGKD
jgi:hypothetical protein